MFPSFSDRKSSNFFAKFRDESTDTPPIIPTPSDSPLGMVKLVLILDEVSVPLGGEMIDDGSLSRDAFLSVCLLAQQLIFDK